MSERRATSVMKPKEAKDDDMYFVWFKNPNGGDLQMQVCADTFLPKGEILRKEKLTKELADQSLLVLCEMFPIATLDDGRVMILHPLKKDGPIMTSSLTEGFQ